VTAGPHVMPGRSAPQRIRCIIPFPRLELSCDSLGAAWEALMAKKARKKAASTSKTKRAKPRTTVRARSKVGSRTRLKATTKPRPRKASRKAKPASAPPAGIIARMESAIHAVVDGIRETAAMREKMHRPGMPDAT